MAAASLARPAALLALLLLFAGNSPAAAPSPESKSPTKVDFERHIMGLVSKAGCNSGSCHGSFQGKGGFRLSLFGYDPDKDFAAVTRDGLGRRVNAVEPGFAPGPKLF